MQEEYNQAVAEHYAAYRPPLHKIILGKLIPSGQQFEAGLDIGCGTGYSSIALSNYCDHVTGIDPSSSMIDQAIQHPSISYLQGDENRLTELRPESIDVVTFAGSLYYAKNDKLYHELQRLLRPRGQLLIYDFQVILDTALQQLDPAPTSVESDYQYIVDLTDWKQFKSEVSQTEQISLPLSPEQLSHILLADSNIYSLIAGKLGYEGLYPKVVSHFNDLAKEHPLIVTLYYSRVLKD